MKILFTKSSIIGSRAIRWATGEPVSHCAIEWANDDVVAHATMGGVEFWSVERFRSSHTVVLEVDIGDCNHEEIEKSLVMSEGKPYDYLAVLYLGVYFLARKAGIPWTPKTNAWASRRAFECVELITTILYGEQNSLLTPYGLYLKLIKEPPLCH